MLLQHVDPFHEGILSLNGLDLRIRNVTLKKPNGDDIRSSGTTKDCTVMPVSISGYSL